MVGKYRIYHPVILLSLCLLLSGCQGDKGLDLPLPTPKPFVLPTSVPFSEEPLIRQLENRSGLIAYVSSERNIRIADQTGGGQIVVTEDALVGDLEDGRFLIYGLPAWSNQGRRLAYVGFSGHFDQGYAVLEQTTVYVKGEGNRPSAPVYVDVAGEQPLTLAWSPDDRYLIFLSQSFFRGETRALFVVDLQEGGTRPLAVSDSLFWSWSPVMDRLLLHQGRGTRQDLLFVNLGEFTTQEVLPGEPGGYNAPAFSPDGTRILLAGPDDRGNRAVFLADGEGNNPLQIGNFGISTGMGWSPDGSYAAYIANHTTANQTIGPLTIFNTADGSEVLTSEEEKVIAFFWSPDSRKIAYFVVVQRDLPEDAPPEAPTTELDVRVLDIETGESLSLQKFLPSEEFHEFLSMFDQQGQSLSIWSPNSERITISGYLENGPHTPGIFLIPIDGEGATRSLAPGYIGVWSWE